MRSRLIAAFIAVALLAALASAWVANLVVPFYPSLGKLLRPALISHLFGFYGPGTGRQLPGLNAPGPGTALAVALAASGLLLATITGLAFAAARTPAPVTRCRANAATAICRVLCSSPGSAGSGRSVTGPENGERRRRGVPLDRAVRDRDAKYR